MEIISHETKVGFFARGWMWLKSLPEKICAKIVEIAKQAKKVGNDDPRRVIHSLKVGLALTLVSMFYYFQPLYNSFGVSAMWAIMTVVVIFEFSVGATLGKGLNRGMATLLAGVLGVGAHYLASATGKVVEPILLGLFVFLQAFASTFIRFFPKVKARYDYGMLIFILTFCLVSISGFRVDEIVDMAHKRVSTILIGASVCVVVSIFVYPVWAGEDLHKLVALNMEKIANFLEGFGDEFFKSSKDIVETKDAKTSLVEYKSVLNSKNIEETLANFARWEPGHGQFMYRHPWKQYLKIGSLVRQCASRIDALNAYINSEFKAPEDIKEMIKETSTKMSMESGKALKELSFAMKTMTLPMSSDKHVVNSKTAAKNLKSLLKSGFWEENINLLEVIPVAAVASILTDIVFSVEEISEAVKELATLAHFKETKVVESNETTQSCRKIYACSQHVVVTIHESSTTVQLTNQNVKS